MRDVNKPKQFIAAWRLFAMILLVAAAANVYGQDRTYKVGDRVECDTTSTGKYWTKGKVIPFRSNDWPSGMEPDGSWYRVKADVTGNEYYCKSKELRPLAEAAREAAQPAREKTAKDTDADGTQQADREILACPVQQKQVKNGARPDPELLKKIIRCSKGEKPAEKGLDEAVTVEVSGLQIGTARPWSPSRDIGNGKLGTIVYPVKATFSVKYFYRTRTVVEEDAIRVLNFYVNAFGEWQIGSQETLKSAVVKSIPKQ